MDFLCFSANPIDGEDHLDKQEITTQLDRGLYFSILCQNGIEKLHSLFVPLLQGEKNGLGMK